MKKDYMTRLERAARWRLPRQEAEDVIADYRDIVGDPPRPDEELLRDLGKPRDAIRPLVQKKPYYTWLAVFAALCACILIPGISSIGFFPTLSRLCFALDTWGWVPLLHLGPVLALAGAAGALVWSRKNGLREGKLSQAVTILLVMLSVWIVFILAADWCWMRDPQGFAEMWGWKRPTFFGLPYGPPDYQTSRSLDLLVLLTQYGGIATTVLGIAALVKARTGDRRWAAVYILAMTAMLVTLETFSLLCGQDRMPGGIFTLQWSSLAYYAAAALVGAVGTGMALC